MKLLTQSLIALSLSTMLLSGCGKKDDSATPPSATQEAAPAAPAPEAPKAEPVKEEPGGWVPPASDKAPAPVAPTAESAPVAAPDAAPTDANK